MIVQIKNINIINKQINNNNNNSYYNNNNNSNDNKPGVPPRNIPHTKQKDL